MSDSTVLIVPGLRGPMPEHWQTLLAARLKKVRSLEHPLADGPDLATRVAAIEQALRSLEGPVILVAHSAGVLAVAHWASRHARPILGALLVTPPDLQAAPAQALRDSGWGPLPEGPLPFPSIVVASSNDPMASLEATGRLARQWGAELLELGAVGHLNPASGFGEWPLAEALIARLDA